MTVWSKDLVLYRMVRAKETLEDARILANAGRRQNNSLDVLPAWLKKK